MDLNLPLLADANFHLEVASEAVSEGNYETARRELDKADDALSELRTEWEKRAEEEKGLLAAMAKPLAAKSKDLKARIPERVVVAAGEVIEDPEQELEPDEA